MANRTIKLPVELWAGLEVEAKRRMFSPEVMAMVAISDYVLSQQKAAVAQAAAEEENDDEEEADGELARSTNISGYKGVFPHGDRWRVLYRGAVIGTFDTVFEAAKARKHAHCAWTAQKQGLKDRAEQEERAALAKQRETLMQSLSINTDPVPKVDFVQPYNGPRGRKPGERAVPKVPVEPTDPET